MGSSIPEDLSFLSDIETKQSSKKNIMNISSLWNSAKRLAEAQNP